MEASIGKKLLNRAGGVTRISVMGKENISPSDSHDPVRTIRSPLPAGFPRAPLQDITSVLCRQNVTVDDEKSSDSGDMNPLRKRFKCVGGAKVSADKLTCESESHSFDLKLRCLHDCSTSVTKTNMVGHLTMTEVDQTICLEKKPSVVSSEARDDLKTGRIKRLSSESFEARDVDRCDGTSRVGVNEVGSAGGTPLGHQMPNSQRRVVRSVSRKVQNSAEGSAARVGLRSLQEKSKTSSLMKFR
ncbi:hypothetical protein KP509_15G014100 [Ceratopteris richardii]|uniref:Uncharacterized protein n=1 Tax=Ceratopteris richardii TaxID=49495 RepID=A0A8T2T189_CERRI|nr:hypothetical protein KP509_15G014100 [Ceratopteris richardii]